MNLTYYCIDTMLKSHLVLYVNCSKLDRIMAAGIQDKSTLYQLAKHGYMRVITMRSFYIEPSAHIIVQCSIEGFQHALLEWFLQGRYFNADNLAEVAAKHNNLKALQIIIARYPNVNLNWIADFAVKHNLTEIAEYLIALQIRFNIDYAITCKRPQMVCLIAKTPHHFRITGETFRLAILSNNREIMRAIASHSPETKTAFLEYADKRGESWIRVYTE
jgi:hypothetical protein